jgi:predicted NACHT family NTPase
MVKYNAPNRALIIATADNGKITSRRISYTNYGAQRHAVRWLARGYKHVTVHLSSNSTGKLLNTVRLGTV